MAGLWHLLGEAVDVACPLQPVDLVSPHPPPSDPIPWTLSLECEEPAHHSPTNWRGRQSQPFGWQCSSWHRSQGGNHCILRTSAWSPPTAVPASSYLAWRRPGLVGAAWAQRGHTHLGWPWPCWDCGAARGHDPRQYTPAPCTSLSQTKAATCPPVWSLGRPFSSQITHWQQRYSLSSCSMSSISKPALQHLSNSTGSVVITVTYQPIE